MSALGAPSVLREDDRNPHPGRLLGSTFAACAGDPAVAHGAHRVRWRDGSSTPVHLERWFAEPSTPELELLALAVGPVLDVGCGPGRHVAELGRRHVDVLGIDVLPEAVRAGRRTGAAILGRSVFERLPREGEWATALLLDGNVGIGGDPEALLKRTAELLAPGGRVLLEVEGPGIGVRSDRGRLETPHGSSRSFAWGRVGIDGVESLAYASGFGVAGSWRAATRWFARLELVR